MMGTMSQFSPPGISNAAQRSLKTFRMLYLPIDHTREQSCNAAPRQNDSPLMSIIESRRKGWMIPSIRCSCAMVRCMRVGVRDGGR
jgi:hypothetical protein